MLRVSIVVLLTSCVPSKEPAERDTDATPVDTDDDTGAVAGESGAPQDSDSAPPDDTDTGGSAEPDWRDGVLVGDATGGAAGSAGTLAALDLDGDGVDELVVGAPGTRDGQVWVVSGEVLPEAEGLLRDAASVALMGWFAGWLAPYRGDANGDGVDDLAVGRGETLLPGTGAGAVYLFQGGEDLASATSLLDARAEIDEQTGGEMVRFGALGDLDGDGLADLVVGASQANDADWEWGDSGMVSIWLEGGPTGSHSTADADDSIFGTWFEEGLGATLAAGDLDDDGYADLLVGAPEWETDLGVVGVVRGQASGDWPHQLEAAATTLVYGAEGVASLGNDPFCSLGDLDADGSLDLVVTSSAVGGVWLWSGVPTGVTGPASADVQVMGDAGTLGAAVACDGDLDGDGADDLLVGDPLADGVGAVHLFLNPLGGAGALGSAAADRSLYGASDGDKFGAAIRALDGLRGDGIGTFAVGAPGADAGAINGGATYLYTPR